MIASLESLPAVDRVQEDVAEAKEDSRGEELNLQEFSVVVDEDVAEEVCRSCRKT